MYCSSSRVMRIITGALAFFDSSAATAVKTDDEPLLPKPPPVYSLMMTTFGRIDADPARHGADRPHRALRRAVHVELAVLPVGHRGPRFERLVAGVRPTKVSSRTRSACLNPASRSPTVHSSVCLPSGSWPSSAAAKSSVGPLQLLDLRSPARCGGGAGAAACAGGGGAGRTQTLPSVRAFGPAGPQALHRIDDEGQRLELDLDLSIASAAVNSSTAATARIGSPS